MLADLLHKFWLLGVFYANLNTFNFTEANEAWKWILLHFTYNHKCKRSTFLWNDTFEGKLIHFCYTTLGIVQTALIFYFIYKLLTYILWKK